MLQENEVIASLPEYQLYAMQFSRTAEGAVIYLFIYFKEWKNSWGQKLLGLAQGKPPSVIN